MQAGSYDAADLVNEFNALFTDGVAKTTDGGLVVTALGTPNLSVNVAPGSALKVGLFLNSNSIENVVITANASGYNRYDVIVADLDNNVITSVLGTPTSSPTVPILTGNKVALANVLVGNNVSVINTVNITDARAEVHAGSLTPNKRLAGTFVRSANVGGTQAVPLGFTPSFVTIVAIHSADKTFKSDGSCDGTNQVALGEYSTPNNTSFSNLGQTIALNNGASLFYGIVTFVPLGFSIEWYNTGGNILIGNIILKIEAWG